MELLWPRAVRCAYHSEWEFTLERESDYEQGLRRRGTPENSRHRTSPGRAPAKIRQPPYGHRKRLRHVPCKSQLVGKGRPLAHRAIRRRAGENSGTQKICGQDFRASPARLWGGQATMVRSKTAFGSLPPT